MAKDIIINFKGNMDASQIKSSLQSVQNQLKGMKLSPSLTKDLTEEFKQADKVITNIENKLANGFKTKSDVTGIAKDFKQVTTIIDNLNKDLSKVTDKDIKLNIDTTKISTILLKDGTVLKINNIISTNIYENKHLNRNISDSSLPVNNNYNLAKVKLNNVIRH